VRERWKVARRGQWNRTETVHLQGVGARKGDGVPIEEWSYELRLTSLLKSKKDEGIEKSSFNERLLVGVDPKLGELFMARLNFE
jgi:hypothetical protein